MADPDCVFPESEYPSDVELWLEDRVAVMCRVGSLGPLLELSPGEARRLGAALVELADLADAGA